jgi:hypothetical protein
VAFELTTLVMIGTKLPNYQVGVDNKHCHFLIVPSMFSSVYLEKMTVSVLVSDYTCENDVLLV